MEFIKSKIHMVKYNKKYNICDIVVILLILGYASVLFYFYIQTNCLVPDEGVFISYSDKIELSNIAKTENLLGYGALYWISLGIANGNIVVIRILSFIYAISVPISLCLTLKYVKKLNSKQILLAMICFLSMPLSWFTGKIIGPELMSNAIGSIGAFMVLYNKSYKKVCFNLGVVLIGIATGIKLPAAIFAVFSFLILEIGKYKKIYFKNIKYKKYALKRFFNTIIRWIIFGLIGMIIANPIMITNWSKFIENILAYSDTSGISISYLNNVLFKENIEWDFVNSGGLQHTIICLFALVVIMFPSNKRENIYKISASVCIVLLVIISINSKFLGWYLMPLLYIVPLCISDNFMTVIVLLLNLFFIRSDIAYQFTSKLDQIWINEHKPVIQAFVSEYDSQYMDYEKYYFIDTNMDLPLTPVFSMNPYMEARRIIYIYQRDKNDSSIRNIEIMAKEEINGYRIIDKKCNILVIVQE